MTLPARRSVVIHGHFYQPPREDPWLDLVDREPNAAPFHDWNERIEHECYRAVLAARVAGPDGGIRRILNSLEWISYNVGPTLLEWMERESPATYHGFLAADRVSAERLGGHGNAIAMPYHHVILPLASHRDKVTEVRWGIADFRRRFGRDPVGMWLPETAVDDETLDVVAAEGIAFTILAPRQVKEAPPAGLPGRYRTQNGRTIAVFVYDGAMAHDVAFGPLVQNADLWIRRLLAAELPARGPLLQSIATDGETYGHHHKFGDMALAATIDALGRHRDVQVENYASFLARHPPAHDLELIGPSSWSCSHGVERWRSDCGCRMAPGTQQAWRGPLRVALEWLGEELDSLYDAESRGYFDDPWAARTAYAMVSAPTDLPGRARELIELERNSLRMFTSCGWFFDDVGGIETIQILKYAARAIDLAGAEGLRLTRGLLARLERAVSNDPAVGTAKAMFEASVRPRWAGDERAASGFAVVAALCPEQTRPVIGAYLVGALGEGVIQTQHRRTGEVERFATYVHRIGWFGVAVDLNRTNGHTPVTLGLEALPDRERRLAREVLRREALREVLSAEELVRLAHGSSTYADALRATVLRLVPERAGDGTEAGAARLALALDLLALEEFPISFEAQTRFYRFLSAADPTTGRPYQPLIPRFGFVISAFGARHSALGSEQATGLGGPSFPVG